MENFSKNRKEFSRFLTSLAHSYPNSLTISTLKQEFDEKELQSFINFIDLFGVITLEKNSIKLKNDHAKSFVLSLSTYVSENLKLIDNWKSLYENTPEENKSILNSGIRFIHEMEVRRTEKLNSKVAYREIENMSLIIKAKLESFEKEVYLFQFDSESLMFKPIGGKISQEENLESQISKLVKRELSSNQLEYPKDYTFQDFSYPIETFKVSNKTGLYTKHKVFFYQLNFNNNLKLTTLDRWLTLEELEKGVTIDGIEILSYFKYIPDKENFVKKLRETNLSFGSNLPLTNFIASLDNKNSLLDKRLNQEESEELEFKSSLRWDYKLNNVNKALEKVIAKTINGFLNTSGGTLIIGVDDDKKILGIEKDLETLQKKNTDGFMQFIVALIGNSMGVEFTNKVKITFEEKEGKTTCIVVVKRSKQPVFLKEGQNREFYVRAGNTTRELNIEEIYKYIQLNW